MTDGAGPHAIGIDIGGTSIRAAVIAADAAIVDIRRVPTPQTAADAEQALVDVTTTLASRHPVTAVGLAAAGFISRDRREVMFAPHLPWRDDPVPARLSARLGLPVVLDHDVNAAAVAEHLHGSAGGARVALVIAVGTGIGAGLLIDGTLYRGAFGVAPEFGHVVVRPDGRPCPCGKRGCWERYCSGTALAQTAREAWDSGAWGAPTALADLAGGDPNAVTGSLVVTAARAGDGIALRAIEEFGRSLGEGIALACDVVDPEIVVIGGGVSASADLYLETAREVFSQRLTGYRFRPKPSVVLARFGSRASMVGAGLMALQPDRW